MHGCNYWGNALVASTTGQKYAQIGYNNFLLNPKPKSMNLWLLSAVQPWEGHVTSLTLSSRCYKSELLILPADSADQAAPAPLVSRCIRQQWNRRS